jgi:hypothetical protein
MNLNLNLSHIVGTIIGGLVVWFLVALITKDIVIQDADTKEARVKKQVLGFNLPELGS